MHKIKYKGISIQIRAINELDLLGFDTYIPIFTIDREYEKNWLNKAIDEKNEKLNKTDKQRQIDFKKHIIDNCLIDAKLSLIRRVLLKILRYKKNTLEFIKNDKEWCDVIFNEIYNISTTIGGHKVNQKTAEAIYYIYEGMNYADQYFKGTELNAIEKDSFNRLIHNTGITSKNRRMKANG